MARTMTDEQERAIRVWADGFPQYKDEGFLMMVLRELDAERAAHEVTRKDAEGWRNGQAQVQRDFDLLYADTQALKARLALAEALDTAATNFMSPARMGCSLEELRAGVVQMAHTQPDARAAADTLALIDALAAWRAAK